MKKPMHERTVSELFRKDLAIKEDNYRAVAFMPSTGSVIKILQRWGIAMIEENKKFIKDMETHVIPGCAQDTAIRFQNEKAERNVINKFIMEKLELQEVEK